jgi:diguanylate cyclase (GGDEF)-like protein
MKKILVVDDSKTILTMLKLEIKKYNNIDAYYAEDYKSAMRLISEHRGKFNAALLDLNLTDAPEGEVVKLANANKIPAVVLSATMNEKLKNSIMKKDVVDFILKDDQESIKFAVKAIQRIIKNYDTTILIVDDSKTYRHTLRDSLTRIHLNVLEAENGKEALKILELNPSISLIITDYEMPIMNGLELTLNIRKKFKKDQLSIITISTIDKQEVISKFLRFGANDFIHKPFTHNEIITRINANLEILDLFSQIKDMANKDFLTGMFNRRYFFDSGYSIYRKNNRKGKDIAIVMIDIDNFKKINDNYGHNVGDDAIIAVKDILANNLRDSDLTARFGGEEFCILLEEITKEQVVAVFEKIRAVFKNNIIETNYITISYTVSIGIYFGMINSLDEMIKLSDEALYEAKESGRNRVVIKS